MKKLTYSTIYLRTSRFLLIVLAIVPLAAFIAVKVDYLLQGPNISPRLSYRAMFIEAMICWLWYLLVSTIVPVYSLHFSPPILTLKRRGKTVAQYDLSKPYGLLIVVYSKKSESHAGTNTQKLLSVEVYIFQNGRNLSFYFSWVLDLGVVSEKSKLNFIRIKKLFSSFPAKINLKITDSSPHGRLQLIPPPRFQFFAFGAKKPLIQAHLPNYADWFEVMKSFSENNLAIPIIRKYVKRYRQTGGPIPLRQLLEKIRETAR